MALRYGVLFSLVSLSCGLDFTDVSGELPDQPESSPSVADVESPAAKSDVLEQQHPDPREKRWFFFPGAIVHTASKLCLTARSTVTLGPACDVFDFDTGTWIGKDNDGTSSIPDGTELSMSVCDADELYVENRPNAGFGQRWVHDPDAGTLVLAAHDNSEGPIPGTNDCNTWRYYIEGNQCVDAPSGNLNAAQNLQVWQCNGMPQQQFGFDDEVYDTYHGQRCSVHCDDISRGCESETTSECMQGGGGTIFASESSDASLCLDVWSDNVDPSFLKKNLWLWDCLANENQLFKWLRPALDISSSLTGDEAGPSFVV